MLEVRNLSVILQHKPIVSDVSFELHENDILMIVGPNGAGKSTLIRAMMQLHPHKGRVLLNGRDIASMKTRELATRIGVLTQRHQLQFPQTVWDIVSLGRYAHNRILGRLGTGDRLKIESALTWTGLSDLAGRSALTLSGGEVQRVFLAQLLAQDPDILILDEPTNHLDLKYQMAIFDIIKKWSAEPGKSVLAVVHDLNTVFSFGTRALLMHQGCVYRCGGVEEVLTPENLEHVYQVDVASWMQNLMKHWRY